MTVSTSELEGSNKGDEKMSKYGVDRAQQVFMLYAGLDDPEELDRFHMLQLKSGKLGTAKLKSALELLEKTNVEEEKQAKARQARQDEEMKAVQAFDHQYPIRFRNMHKDPASLQQLLDKTSTEKLEKLKNKLLENPNNFKSIYGNVIGAVQLLEQEINSRLTDKKTRTEAIKTTLKNIVKTSKPETDYAT